MKNILFIFILTFGVFFAGQASETNVVQKGSDVHVFSIEDSQVHNPEWRKKYATALLREIEALYDAIPHLKPDQKEWLEKERERESKIKDKDSKFKAFIELVESKEFALERVKRGLGLLVMNLKDITGDTSIEVTGWAQVSSALTDTDVFERLAYLERAGGVKLPQKSQLRRNTKEIDTDEWALMTNLLGRNILDRIVVPNLFRLETAALARESGGGNTNRSKVNSDRGTNNPSVLEKQKRP